MIVWQGRFCRFGDDSASRADVDVLRHFHCSTPVPGGPCSPMQTILIELAPDPEALLAAVSKDTRYEIHRAGEKDGLQCEAMEATGQAVEEFVGYYAQFAALKGLPSLSPNGGAGEPSHVPVTDGVR